MKQVLFICSANYYRSRFAEHLFNWLAPQVGLPWRADSRGLLVDYAKEHRLYTTVCTPIVRQAAEILDELL